MTVSRQPDPAAASEVVVRCYADRDYEARHQWLPGARLHGLDFDY